jgi:hypothetical protein
MRSVSVGFWLFVAAIAAIGVSKTVLSDTLDPDLFWHLRVAEQLRAEGIHPLIDTLSFTSIKQPWTPYSWLAELFMEWSWRVLGWQSAIAWEAAATIAIIILIALCTQERRPVLGPVSRLNCAIATTLGAIFAIPYLAFRPVAFAIVLLGICAWLLLRDRRLEERSRAVWLIVPLTALCTNIHLAAAIAPVWVGCLFVGAIGERDEPNRRQRMIRYGALLGATALASLATPMLPGVVRTGWHYLVSDVMVASGGIAEVQPLGPGMLALTVFVILIALCGRGLRIGEGLWLLVAAMMMLRMNRFAPMFAFIAAPLIAAALPRLPDALFARRPIIAMLAIALLVSTIRLAVGFPWLTPMNQWINRRGAVYPTAAADYVDALPRRGRMINEFNWGGYLAWRLGGKYQVFVDGRTQLYDEKFWRSTYLGSDDDLTAAIKPFDADVAIIPARRSRFRAALQSLGWKTVRVDDVAEVLTPPAR